MFNSTNSRAYCLIGALGVLTLLSTDTVLTQQDSVELAYTRELVPRSVPQPTAGWEASFNGLAVDQKKGKDGSEPWTSSQVQRPADLAKELSDPKTKKPLIICVGFRSLYQSARIPGALFHGPAGKPEGLEELKKWAQNVPRESPIVLYCGCCPWDRCPNIRPAFQTLHEMGFTRLRVLSIDTDFATDWVQKGFPVQRGK